MKKLWKFWNLWEFLHFVCHYHLQWMWSQISVHFSLSLSVFWVQIYNFFWNFDFICFFEIFWNFDFLEILKNFKNLNFFEFNFWNFDFLEIVPKFWLLICFIKFIWCKVSTGDSGHWFQCNHQHTTVYFVCIIYMYTSIQYNIYTPMAQ